METRDVKLLRTQMGLTQEQFAEKIGVSQTQVCRWEKNGLPDRKLVINAFDRLSEATQGAEG